ncbi:hypothetical protein ACU1JV_14995 [Paenibacillus sp. T2-29]
MENESPLYEGLGFSPATNKEEFLSLLKQKPNNLITNKEELDKYFQTFNFLETESKKNFLDEIEFGEQGVEGFRYDILAEKLTFKQFCQLLGRMGMSLELFADKKDHRCKRLGPSEPKDCHFQAGYTCSPTCGSIIG